MEAAFVAAASDFAWFELYFNEQPGNAGKWVAALEGVLPEDSTTLQRLRGWLQLASNQPDEARKTLGTIQDVRPPRRARDAAPRGRRRPGRRR